MLVDPLGGWASMSAAAEWIDVVLCFRSEEVRGWCAVQLCIMFVDEVAMSLYFLYFRVTL